MADPFIGEIRIVGFPYAPEDWANADGALIPVNQNPALFSLYGTLYGGDGRTDFGLPDLRGRVPIHVGHGPGLTNHNQGDAGGAELVTLVASQTPVHTHKATAYAKAATADQTTPDGHFWSEPGRNAYSAEQDCKMNENAVQVEANQGGDPHANMQPYLTLRFIVSLDGMYPQRQ